MYIYDYHRYTHNMYSFTHFLHNVNSTFIILWKTHDAPLTISSLLQDLEQFLIGAGVAKSKILPVQGQIELESTWKALVEGALKRFGRIDVLVNNAAVSSAPGCDPNGLQSLDYIMQVNVRAPYGLTLEAAPHLKVGELARLTYLLQ